MSISIEQYSSLFSFPTFCARFLIFYFLNNSKTKVAYPLLKKYKKKAPGYTNLTMQRDREMNQNKKIITALSTLLLGLIFAFQAN
jgi:hypothetical protein